MTLADSLHATEFYKHETIVEGKHIAESEKDYTKNPPNAIGSYHIQAPIARGGMSQLYLGLHQESTELATIKVLLPKYAQHAQAAARFKKEAKLLQLIDSPYLVKIKEQGVWNDTQYIAMEYIAGISLRDALLHKRYSLQKTVDCICDITKALIDVHAHGIIHRDLKPENILVSPEGKIKLIDLGIAKQPEETEAELSTKTRSRHMMGTPVYMSPEQKYNPQQVTPASDLYSLGVISYELLLGQLSYGSLHLPLLPIGLQRIIRKCILRDPSLRYPSASELLHALQSYLKSEQFQRDAKKRDNTATLHEKMEEVESTLLLAHQPLPIAKVDVGLVQQKGLYYPRVYSDFYTLSAHLSIAVIAECSQDSSDAALYLLQLRSALHLLFSSQAKKEQDPFATLVQCNSWLYQNPIGMHFNVSFAVINTEAQQIGFLSCGSTQGWMLCNPEQITVHPLCSHNAPFGSAENELFSFVIPWNEGDLLLLASTAISQLNDRHELLQKILQETYHESAQRQAQGVWLGLYPFADKLIQQHQSAALIALKCKGD